MHTLPMYILTDGTTVLLTIPVDAVACPYALGQQVALVQADTGVSSGWYIIDALLREQPYRLEPTDATPRTPLLGETITVVLRALEDPPPCP